MKELVILYMLYLEQGGKGRGKVTILILARYMRLSKPTMKQHLEALSDLGYINVYEEFGGGDYKRYKLSLSPQGQEHLENNWNAAMLEYDKHVSETIALIKERNAGKYPPDKKLSKKTAKQLLAGQKELL